MRVFVGKAGLRGSIERYAERFDFLELRAEVGALPRRPRLREWRAAVEDEVAFAVLLPRSVGAFEPTGDAGLEYAIGAADALGARWLVLGTAASFRPTTRNRDRLATLAERLRATGHDVAWQPAGVWEEDDVDALSAELGLVAVRDLTTGEPAEGDVVYTRISRLSGGGRVGVAAAERVGQAVGDRREAFVVIEGDGAARAAEVIRAEAAYAAEVE